MVIDLSQVYFDQQKSTVWNENDGEMTGFVLGFVCFILVKYFVVIRNRHKLIRVNL